MKPVSDTGVNFNSVYSLLMVTRVFCCPGATFRRHSSVVQHQVTCFAQVTFVHVNRTQKLPQGKSSLAHAHYYVQNKFHDKKFQKALELVEYV